MILGFMRFWLSMESQKRINPVIMDIHNWIMDIHNSIMAIMDWIMYIHNSIMYIHNRIMDIHNWIMDTHNWIMDIHNWIMDIHNYRVYALLAFHLYLQIQIRIWPQPWSLFNWSKDNNSW